MKGIISRVWDLSENIFEYILRFSVAIYYWVARRQFLINWPEKTSSSVFTVPLCPHCPVIDLCNLFRSSGKQYQANNQPQHPPD